MIGQMVAATPADVLDAAAAHIEDVGWSPDGPDETGRVCALLAIRHATGWGVPMPALAFQAEEAFRHHVDRPSIVAWNYEQPDAATVIATLHGAAAALRGAA